jgi:hypothetical protein
VFGTNQISIDQFGSSTTYLSIIVVCQIFTNGEIKTVCKTNKLTYNWFLQTQLNFKRYWLTPKFIGWNSICDNYWSWKRAQFMKEVTFMAIEQKSSPTVWVIGIWVIAVVGSDLVKVTQRVQQSHHFFQIEIIL